MAVVNEAQLSNISTHSHLSLQQFYTNTEKANNKWWQKLHKTISRPAPLSGLQLVKYYIQNSPQAPDHIFLDEASLELSANAVTRSASPSTVDIPCTVKVLGELAALLPASSHLWVALHTQHVRDTTGFSVTDAELNQLETSLRSKNFHLPSLRHNMRNTEGVAKVGQECNTSAHISTATSRSIKTALPPRQPFSLEAPPLPVILPCNERSYGRATVLAYRSLGVMAGEEATTPVVVLCEDSLRRKVMANLTAEGVPVQGYFSAGDKAGLETYLTSPQGVLCTGAESFSGMEASRVLWVTTGGQEGGRSALLRAVNRVAIVAVGSNTTPILTPGSVRVDTTYSKCDIDYAYFICSSCSLNHCGHCAQACHQTCTDSSGNPAVGYLTGTSVKCACATGRTHKL